MNFIWKPIHFDDRRKPDDFVAIASGIVVGRVYRLYDGPQHGDWYFNFQLGQAPFRTKAMDGVVKKRRTAQRLADDEQPHFVCVSRISPTINGCMAVHRNHRALGQRAMHQAVVFIIVGHVR
jgi:hypothetical protein